MPALEKPYRILTRPATWQDVIASVPELDSKAIEAMVTHKIVDSVGEVFARWATGHDLYYLFNGKTGVTITVSDDKYTWSWSLSGASAGTEFTILEIPSTVFADIPWCFAFKFVKFNELFPGIDELKIYYKNIHVTSIYPRELRYAGKSIAFMPRIVFSRSTQDFKLTVIPNDYGVSKGSLEMELVGRVAIPLGTKDEPNPKVIKEISG